MGYLCRPLSLGWELIRDSRRFFANQSEIGNSLRDILQQSAILTDV